MQHYASTRPRTTRRDADASTHRGTAQGRHPHPSGMVAPAGSGAGTAGGARRPRRVSSPFAGPGGAQGGDRRTLSPDPSEIDPAPDEVSALSHAQQPERAWSMLLALGNPSAVIPDLED